MGNAVLSADLDGDGRKEEIRLLLERRTGRGGVAVYSDGDEQSRFLRKDYFPFSAVVGDIDNDGDAEVLIGLYDRSKDRSGRFAMKLHVFDYEAGRLKPRWFTDREFEWFGVVRQGDRNLLAVTERSGDRWSLRTWKWQDFGFWLEEPIFVSEEPFSCDTIENGLVATSTGGRRIEVIASGDGWQTRRLR